MPIILSQAINNPPKKQSAKLKRFRKLWAQAEKLEQSNMQLQQRLGEIAIEVEPIMAQAEQAMCANTHDLLDKKLKFLKMKSLAQWQRRELFEWIGDSLTFLNHSEYTDQNRLEQQIQRMDDIVGPPPEDDYDYPDDEDDGAIDIEAILVHFEKDFGLEQAHQRAEFIKQQQGDLFGHEEALAEFDRHQAEEKAAALKSFKEQLEAEVNFDGADIFDEDDDLDPFADFEPQGPEQDPGLEREKQDKADLRKLLDGANVKKLFQQLAKVLHPDREPDKAVQAQKQVLMAQAIKARDEGDILSLFSLHNTHVPGSELEFDNSQLAALCQLLEEQIEKLKQAKSDVIMDTPKQARVYEFFYAASDKKVNKNIADYKKMSQADIENLNDLVKYLSSLKHLKPLLEERYDMSHAVNPMDVFDDIFDHRL